MLPNIEKDSIAVIGLGYVGLPLAVEFSLYRKKAGIDCATSVIGYDKDEKRISELRRGVDRTGELQARQLKALETISLSSNEVDLIPASVFIIAVPTPIDTANQPDLRAMQSACGAVARALKRRSRDGDKTAPIIIFESTVYPGFTEELCIPSIEAESGMRANKDFFYGYSPERVNPGDSQRRLRDIVKLTSGSTDEVSVWVDSLYRLIIKAGTFRVDQIKVAEAAKVIENTQRDLNIALMNELAIIFSKLEIDTLDVLEAAGTKWNFLGFRPGLVGGHCIGVDPYYLTHKAQQVGYHPEVVLAGRRINDGMAKWIVERLILVMTRRGLHVANASVIILGLTFKEDCPDLRNTKVFDLITGLKEYGIEPTVVDPCADPVEAKDYYGLDLIAEIPMGQSYDAIIVAVSHSEFKKISEAAYRDLMSDGCVIMDVKGIVPRNLNPVRI